MTIDNFKIICECNCCCEEECTELECQCVNNSTCEDEACCGEGCDC
jgi:hypothetical protein